MLKYLALSVITVFAQHQSSPVGMQSHAPLAIRASLAADPAVPELVRNSTPTSVQVSAHGWASDSWWVDYTDPATGFTFGGCTEWESTHFYWYGDPQAPVPAGTPLIATIFYRDDAGVVHRGKSLPVIN